MRLRPLVVTLILALVAPFLFAGSTRAEMSAKEMLERSKKGEALASFYIGAMGNAFSWATVYEEGRINNPIYCPPAKVALTPDQIVDIMSRFVDRDAKFADKPAGITLLYALIDAFPCGK